MKIINNPYNYLLTYPLVNDKSPIVMTNSPITTASAAQCGQSKETLSLETVGHHNAVVFYGDNGTKIVILEDSPNSDSKERCAYGHVSRLIKRHEKAVAALQRIVAINGSSSGSKGMVAEFKNVALLALSEIGA